MEVIDPAIELLEEVEFLTQIVSRSRQRICKIARRSGVNVQQDQINGKVKLIEYVIVENR